MNRCVRVIDQDGRSIFSSAARVAKIGSIETFHDVFRRLVPGAKLRVTCVQLKQCMSTADEDAAETTDLDEKILDVLSLLRSCQGIDPTIITFVARPSDEPASTSNASLATQTAGEQTTASEEIPVGPNASSGPPAESINADATAVASGLSPPLQYLSQDEVSTWYDNRSSATRAAVIVDYLSAEGCGFQDGDQRKAVFRAVEGVLQYVTPIGLHALQLDCSVAASQLSSIAAARHPHSVVPVNGEASKAATKMVNSAIAQAIASVQSTLDIQRSVSTLHKTCSTVIEPQYFLDGAHGFTIAISSADRALPMRFLVPVVVGSQAASPIPIGHPYRI